VLAATRDRARVESLCALGVDARHVGELSARVVRDLVEPSASVLVAFPPDGRTDAAIAGELGRAARVVYLSSTAVFGRARGRVDEQTTVDPSEAPAKRRLEAERAYLGSGAAVVRAAGIYGPFRGLHRRLLNGSFRMAGSGSNVVSRIHVADLSRIVLALLRAPEPLVRERIYVAADDAPVPQIEVIQWLCERLGLPLPGSEPSGDVAVSLRHDRAVDNSRVKSALSLRLEFPTYREGFEACFAAER
jgi:nucleoside-diphosphate-sugar epimerase